MAGNWTPRAPRGDMPAYLKGDLIYVGRQHVASVKGKEMHRTFGSDHEILNGGLYFRLDVLRLAVGRGATSIVATDRLTKKVWRVDMDTFRARGCPYSHPYFGDQWGLDLGEWDCTCPPPRPQQLSLGGGL